MLEFITAVGILPFIFGCGAGVFFGIIMAQESYMTMRRGILAIIISMVICTGLIVGFKAGIYGSMEIEEDGYDTIDEFVNKQPKLVSPIHDCLLNDDVISNYEFWVLENKFSKLEKVKKRDDILNKLYNVSEKK